MSRTGASRTSRIPSLGPRGEGWLVLQLVLLAAIAGAAIAVQAPLDGPTHGAAMVLGFIVLVGDLALFGAAVVTLGDSLSPLPMPSASAQLVDRGVYRFIRHPIYSGLILAALGGAIYAASWPALALTVLLAIVLDLKSRREEEWLRQKYAGYREYVARTRRFVPGIY